MQKELTVPPYKKIISRDPFGGWFLFAKKYRQPRRRGKLPVWEKAKAKGAEPHRAELLAGANRAVPKTDACACVWARKLKGQRSFLPISWVLKTGKLSQDQSKNL